MTAGFQLPDQEHGEFWIVAEICSRYLETLKSRQTRGEITKEYYDETTYYLNDFCKYCGALSVKELQKGHVEDWISRRPTWRSPVTKRNAISYVLSAFRFGAEMHDQPNPLNGFKKPPQRPRLQSLSAVEEQQIFDATDQPFRDFLFAAIHTGLRPFCELARLATSEITETDRGMMWRVHSTKNDRTRNIPVRSDVAELTRRLIKSIPDDRNVLFRNSQGNPWKKVTAGARFRRIRDKLGWNSHPLKGKYSIYTCRHTFAHRMLGGYWNDGKGCTIEVLAELMGDTPRVAFDHYGREWGQHYQAPLWKAIGL